MFQRIMADPYYLLEKVFLLGYNLIDGRAKTTFLLAGVFYDKSNAVARIVGAFTNCGHLI